MLPEASTSHQLPSVVPSGPPFRSRPAGSHSLQRHKIKSTDVDLAGCTSCHGQATWSTGMVYGRPTIIKDSVHAHNGYKLYILLNGLMTIPQFLSNPNSDYGTYLSRLFHLLATCHAKRFGCTYKNLWLWNGSRRSSVGPDFLYFVFHSWTSKDLDTVQCW